MGQLVYKTDTGQEISAEEVNEIRKSGFKENLKAAFAIIGIVSTGLALKVLLEARTTTPEPPTVSE